VQAAFDRGQLTLTAAGRAALLPKAVRADLVRRIEGGEKPASAMAAVSRCGAADDPGRSLARLVSCLKRELPRLRGRSTAVRPGRLAHSRPALREALAVLTELVEADGTASGQP
jgi:hypothetical protein